MSNRKITGKHSTGCGTPTQSVWTLDSLRMNSHFLEQDEEVRRETKERELREEAARMKQEQRDAEYLRNNWFDIMEATYYNDEFRDEEFSSEEGWNSNFSL